MIRWRLGRSSTIILLGIVVFFLIPAHAWAAPSEQAHENVHVVRSGETLSIIALRYGTTSQAIAAMNNLSNPDRIYVGQRLYIPIVGQQASFGVHADGGQHVVQPGETLSGIALLYGATIQTLTQINGLRSPHLIFVGQRLIIPGRDPVVSSWPPWATSPASKVAPEPPPSLMHFTLNPTTWTDDRSSR